jgi:hypothetical protein
MPRHRLALRAYASFHGQILVGPHADPNQVEHEAWALLRQQCAHLDRARLMSVRRFFPHGGLVLKVNSVDTMLPGAVASIHALLVQLGGAGGRVGRCLPARSNEPQRERKERPAGKVRADDDGHSQWLMAVRNQIRGKGNEKTSRHLNSTDKIPWSSVVTVDPVGRSVYGEPALR